MANELFRCRDEGGDVVFYDDGKTSFVERDEDETEFTSWFDWKVEQGVVYIKSSDDIHDKWREDCKEGQKAYKEYELKIGAMILGDADA